MKPTLYITNWSSLKLHGPGHRYTIMALPMSWEWGDGRVAIIPTQHRLRAFRSGSLSLEEYRATFEEMMARKEVTGELSPGRLWYSMAEKGGYVEDGSTLCCACSRAEAEAGRCHRVWAAPFLVRAGWRVILDGAEVIL